MEIRIIGSGSISAIKKSHGISSIDIKVSGTGTCDCYGLMSRVSNVYATEGGSINTYASDSISASVYGIGNIYYKGDPENNRQRVVGLVGCIKNISIL